MEVAQSTVAKYMGRRGRLTLHCWKTLLRNQLQAKAPPTSRGALRLVQSFYGLVILSHLRRRLVRVSVAVNLSAKCIAGQATEAFPSSEAPRHLMQYRGGSIG